MERATGYTHAKRRRIFAQSRCDWPSNEQIVLNLNRNKDAEDNHPADVHKDLRVVITAMAPSPLLVAVSDESGHPQPEEPPFA